VGSGGGGGVNGVEKERQERVRGTREEGGVSVGWEARTVGKKDGKTHGDRRGKW